MYETGDPEGLEVSDEPVGRMHLSLAVHLRSSSGCQERWEAAEEAKLRFLFSSVDSSLCFPDEQGV